MAGDKRTLRDLLVKIGLEINDEKLIQLNKGIEEFKVGIIGLAGVTSAAAASLFLLAKSAAATGELRKTAESIGVTFENLQKLQYAARLSGMEADEFKMSMVFLNRSMYEFSKHTEDVDAAYNKLGIRVTKENGKLRDTQSVFFEIVDRLKQMPDGAEKTAIAMELFGRSGYRMISMANSGSKAIKGMAKEAEQLGFVMDDTTARAGEHFNDTLEALMMTIKGFKDHVGASLFPIFQKLIDDTLKWLKANGQIVKQKLTDYVQKLVNFLGAFYNIMGRLLNAFGGLESILKSIFYIATAIFALRALYGLGLMTEGVFALIAALGKLKMSILMAQLAAVAMPVIIGATLVALILLVQDFNSYLEGKDSFTGRFLDFIKNFKSEYPLVNFYLKETYALLKGINSVFDSIAKFLAWYIEINPLFKLFGYGGLPNVAEPVKRSGNSTVHVNAPISVSVPPGTPSEVVGTSIKDGISNAMQDIFMQVGRATEPRCGY